MKKNLTVLLLAVALAASADNLGNLPMGLHEAWTGKVLFNSEGGYNYQWNTNENPIHGWSPLFEALPGDEYTVALPTPTLNCENGRVAFRTPITIDSSHDYTLRLRLKSLDNAADVEVVLAENDDAATMFSTTLSLTAKKGQTLTFNHIQGVDIADAKLELKFGTDDYDTNISIGGISLYDETDRRELWVGTSFFNWCCYRNENGYRIKDMEILGRTETNSWTLPDFDDSMWSEAPMPVGDSNYNTWWPGNENTNYWIRRDFELSEVAKTTRYILRVCHDDSYWIYVNGNLVDSDMNWTSGTTPVEIEIPADYLQVGKNVIATYIRQNWGGRYYDCGMKADPDYYITGDDDADAATALVASEVTVSNIDQTLDYSNNYGGWIELYNKSDKKVDLSRLYVSDDPAQLDKFQLPDHYGVVAPGGYKCIFFDNHPTEPGDYVEQEYFVETAYKQVPFKLQLDGGTLYISVDGRTPFITQPYPAAISRCSFARKAMDSDEWGYNGRPTPGDANAAEAFASQQLAAPTVDTDSRLITSATSLSVDIPDGAILRYTTDGSTPTAENGEESADGNFTVDATTVYRFRLFADGYLPSDVVTRSYIFDDKGYYLPIISLVTDNDNFYGDMEGIYVDGMNGLSGRNHGSSNRNMDWNRPVNVEYITSDGRMVINQEANTCVSGGWSRHYMPASLKLKANKIYNGKNSFDYPFFQYKPFNKYKQLLIRNGGNDSDSPWNGRVRDGITQQMLISNGYYVDAQDFQPVHLFINGEYIGQLNLREPNNRFNGTANYGYDDDEMDAFEYSDGYSQMAGTRDAFEEWLRLSEDAANPATYEELRRKVDMDEVINFFAAITYVGCSDWIMNNNNVKGYRSLPDGKFHLTVLDLDWGWSNNSAVEYINSSWGNELVRIYNNMKQNEEFRRQFVNAYCILHGSVFTPERAVIGDSICNLVETALSWEGRSPWHLWNEKRDRIVSDWARNERISSLRRAYGLGEGMKVKIKSNIPQASLMIDEQDIPGGKFDGTLFAPVTLTASAPAGYVFKGWVGNKNGGNRKEIFGRNDSWHYYDRGSLDNSGWHQPDYDDSSWGFGPGPYGYWLGHENARDYQTTLDFGGNTSNKYPTYYFRKEFTLDAAPQYDDEYQLTVRADDGFVLYVNGVERYRERMPDGEILFETFATSYPSDDLPPINIALQPEWLQAGRNVIAVEVHNNVPGSSDIYWEASLKMLSNTLEETANTANQLALDVDEDTELTAVFEPMAPAQQLADGGTPVRINEVSAGNDIYVNEYAKRDDWIELYNTTDRDIDIAGMYLSDKANTPHKYKIQAADGISTIIPAHGHLLVWASKRNAVSQLHAPFKLDNADGCFVSLQAADDSWIDVLRYDEHDSKETFGRYPDGSNNTYTMARPTIRKTNSLTTYDFDLDDLKWDELLVTTNTFELAKGWNWFSHNLAQPVDVAQMQSGNSEVRGQAASSQSDDRGVWSGDLTALTPSAGYKVLASETHDVILTDNPYNTSLPVTVQKGWNWIGCPLANTTTLDAALGNYQATEGDILVGQEAFAIYTGGEWKGSLTSVAPGHAYMLNCGKQQAFEWNALTHRQRSHRRYTQRVGEPDGAWQFDFHAYPEAMPIVAKLKKNDVTLVNGYEVAAFVGDECRGAGLLEDGLLYLMVYGDEAQEITFRVVDANGKESTIIETITFAALGTTGSPAAPWEMTILDNTVVAESIVLSATELTLLVGDDGNLEATVLPEDAEDKTVTWKSSDNQIVKVSNKGKVRAVAAGEAVITATCGNATATCNVTVEKRPQEIVWTQEFAPATIDDVLEFNATASSELAVVYTITNGDNLASLVDNRLTIIDAGSIEVTATQDGDKTFLAAKPVKKTISAIVNDIGAIAGGNDQVSVFTLAGQPLFQGRAADMPALPTGVYLVHCGEETHAFIVK